MGIYLPMALTLLIPVGATIGYVYNNWASAAARSRRSPSGSAC